MTAEALRSYRFANPAQWHACLFVGADRESPDARDGLRPFTPYEQSAQRYATHGAGAPAATRTGEVLWHDDAGLLNRLPTGDESPVVLPAPFAIARAARLLSMSSGLWVAGDAHDSLQRYEEDTLTRLSSVKIPHARVVDIACDAHDAIFALVERNGAWQSIRINCAGRIVETITFEGISHATAFVFLTRFKRFVVLAGDRHPRLYWFAAKGGAALFSMPIGAMHPCFSASVLGSDSRGRVLVAGADGAAFGGNAYVLIFDGDGAPLGDVPLDARDAPATGITATRDSLLVTGPRGLLRFSLARVVPDRASEVRCMLVTPVLNSPDREDARRWLRIEATANLPAGATLEISYAATDDALIRDRLAAIAQDEALPASHRVQKLLGESALWRAPIVFHGSDTQSSDSIAPLSAPLFDVREPYLWVCITLIAAAGAAMPALSKLAILYPGRSLMENLPAVYRRAEAAPGSFLRALVGVLESTTQGLDKRIAALGSHVHPSMATSRWLDFIARWLGLPWDDALEGTQKRNIVMRAAELAQGRGTRAGLEAFLECLMPGQPRCFRVTDATADFGFATVGGAACRGSALPALLGGHTQWSAELDSRAVLGCMRLPCAGQLDDGAWQIAGHIRIDVAASANQRRVWEPWLLALIKEMVPLTARVTLRWVGARAQRGDRLDGSLTLEPPPTPHLGTDAVTGIARLPERGSRLTTTGSDVGTHLH
jgi:phage tail-like protein